MTGRGGLWPSSPWWSYKFPKRSTGSRRFGLAQKIIGFKPWKFTNISFDPAWMDTIPNLWDRRLKRFPNKQRGGIVFITPPPFTKTTNIPSDTWPILQIPSTTSWKCAHNFSQCKPHPRVAKFTTPDGVSPKSQVNGRDHGRFVVLLMKQPEISVDFFDRKKSSFGIENFNYLVLMAKNLTIFLGWLLNHPLKNPCI